MTEVFCLKTEILVWMFVPA